MIYICIPAHNEEQTVGVLLWKIRQVLSEFPRDYQLLVADDASTDGTAEVLAPYIRVLPLTVVTNPRRLGYAASVEMLVREAVRRSAYPKRDTIIVIQGDFSEDPDQVVTLVKRIEAGADIVAGDPVEHDAAPWGYQWTRRAAHLLLRRLEWPQDAGEPLDGLRAYRVFCVKRAVEDRAERRLLEHEGWGANAQLLRSAAPHARRIETMPVSVRHDRIQRSSRFHWLTALRQVASLVSGRPASGLVPAAELMASMPETVERQMVVIGDNGDEKRPRRSSRPRRRTRKGAGARAQASTSGDGGDGDGGAEEEAGKTTSRRTPRRRSSSRRGGSSRRKSSAESDAGATASAESEGAGAATATAKPAGKAGNEDSPPEGQRRRRSGRRRSGSGRRRRGGGRRKNSNGNGTADGAAPSGDGSPQSGAGDSSSQGE